MEKKNPQFSSWKAENDGNQSQIFIKKQTNRGSPEPLSSRQKIASDKEINDPQSPISIRHNKTSSKNFQPALSNLQQINSTQSQIHELINELDVKLKANYHTKQNNLIEAYRQQLIKAHKDLIELKNNTNEQQIKNQMNEKYLQLKKQRLQLIQVNMFYSNKCMQYKKLLDQKLSEADELQKQIQFLEKQINNSHQKKIDLMSQVYENNSPIKTQNKNYHDQSENNFMPLQSIRLQSKKKLKIIQSATPNLKTSLSTHANTEVMKKISLSSASKDKIKANLTRMPQLNNQVKKLFEQKLNGQQNSYTDRSNISKNETFLNKLSSLKSQKLERKKQNSQIENFFISSVNQIKEKRPIKKDIALFKGQQFTDLEKREIMKSFLSKEEVKQYIYNIIFNKADDSLIFKKKNVKQKFKIVASQKKTDSNDF